MRVLISAACLGAAALCGMSASSASAQTWSSNAPQVPASSPPTGVLLHPYPAQENFCPYGLQPVTLGGVICCGTPNTTEPYFDAHGSSRRSYSCPPGAKGCS